MCNASTFNGDNNMPVRVGAVVGGKLGDIYANNLMKRNNAGQVIVNAQGFPQPATGNGNLEQYLLSNPIGNIQPDLLMSVTPSLTFKGISANSNVRYALRWQYNVSVRRYGNLCRYI